MVTFGGFRTFRPSWYMYMLINLYHLFVLKINLQHFANPEETCHYLLITAAMFGLLNKVNICQKSKGMVFVDVVFMARMALACVIA